MKVKFEVLRDACYSLRGKKVGDVLKDLPKKPTNSDDSDNGTYADEGLSDPGIVDPITGSGGGPVIGSRQ